MDPLSTREIFGAIILRELPSLFQQEAARFMAEIKEFLLTREPLYVDGSCARIASRPSHVPEQ